jgi:hypothetical protein
MARDPGLLRARLSPARLAPWLAGAVLVAGVCAFGVTRLTSGGAAPAGPVAPKTVPLPPRVLTVAHEFVATAVARKNLALAWTLAAPTLREGLTLARWKTGTIPVPPYPVAEAAAHYTVQTSYPQAAVLRVTFTPPPASSTAAGDFLITLHRIGGRWLVASWAPRTLVHAGG